MVSPSTGLQPGTSRLKGGFLNIPGWTIAVFKDMVGRIDAMIRQGQNLVIVIEIQDMAGTENDPGSPWFRKRFVSKVCALQKE